MKTVIEMAREAGFEARRGWWVRDQVPEDIFAASVNITTKIEAFAALVRADEREKYKWDVHSCGPTCTKAACVAMREAVKAEREAACDIVDYELGSNGHAEAIKIAIRARGQQ